MIVSIAMAVLPVPRSPMISSRWPRPIGIIESIAFMPVCIGSWTDLRAMMPGALISTWRLFVPAIGLPPSTGMPIALTTRPSSSSPTGTSTMRPVRLTVSPSRIDSNLPRSATPTLSSSRLSTMPLTFSPPAPSNSRSSPAMRAGQAVDARDAVAGGEHGAGLGDRDLLVVVLDLLADDVADLCGADIHDVVVLTW